MIPQICHPYAAEHGRCLTKRNGRNQVRVADQ